MLKVDGCFKTRSTFNVKKDYLRNANGLNLEKAFDQLFIAIISGILNGQSKL